MSPLSSFLRLMFLAGAIAAAGAAGCAAPVTAEDDDVEVVDDALVESNRQFIQKVADDIGEYFHYDSSEYAANIVPVSLSALPARLRAVAEARAEEEADSVRSGNGEGGATVSDEAYKIVRNGRTVGYVIGIDHAIDHPLWDGSGVHVYYDTRRKVVTEVSWTG